MELANSPDRLNGLKRQLLDHRKQLALFDMEKFAKNLERIYTDLHQSNN
jgi:predicted O-linked N-acetylglucosamine transferase (SPINDLY family)